MDGMLDCKAEVCIKKEVSDDYYDDKMYDHQWSYELQKPLSTKSDGDPLAYTIKLENTEKETIVKNEIEDIDVKPLIIEEVNIKEEATEIAINRVQNNSKNKYFKLEKHKHKVLEGDLQHRVRAEKKSFVCEVCKEGDLQHRVRAEKKSFVCEVCKYKCFRKTRLRNHMRIHTGEKPHMCTLCDFKCSEKSSLNYHIRTHTGEKPFACKVCDYKFSRKALLHSHMKTHTGEKPFMCEMCDYRCSRKTLLCDHARIHTGEKPFMCNVCDYKCSRRIYLYRHVKTKHTKENLFV